MGVVVCGGSGFLGVDFGWGWVLLSAVGCYITESWCLMWFETWVCRFDWFVC